jgi:hypothetical protein
MSKFIVDFGSNTDPETFNSMSEIEVWIDSYITEHLQSHEDFETEKAKFLKNQVSEIVEE